MDEVGEFVYDKVFDKLIVFEGIIVFYVWRYECYGVFEYVYFNYLWVSEYRCVKRRLG